MALTDNLYFCYEFENNGNDATANALNLTNNNAATFSAGKVNTATDLVIASAQSWSRASEAAYQTGDIKHSLVAWAKATAVGATQYIVCRDDGTNREYVLGIGDLTAGKPFFRTFASSYVEWGTAMSGDTYAFIVASYNSTTDTQTISVNDGTPVTASVGARTAASTSIFTIGKRQATGAEQYWGGQIDQVLGFKRDLFETPADITSLYNGGAGLSFAAMSGDLLMGQACLYEKSKISRRLFNGRPSGLARVA